MVVNASYFLFLLFLLQIIIIVQSKAKKEKEAVKKDLPLIACDVCEIVVGEIYHQISDLREKAPYNKLEEIEVLELLDNVCKHDEKQGGWMRRYDIIERNENSKRVLALESPGGYSKCDEECATIKKSCSNMIEDEVDKDDLSALLWKGTLTLPETQIKICEKWTKRCPNKNYLSKTYKRIDYPFKVIKEKDLEMEQLLAKMQQSGLGGLSMYNRDDMEDMMNNGGYGADGDMADMYDDGPYGGDIDDEAPISEGKTSSMDFEL